MKKRFFIVPLMLMSLTVHLWAVNPALAKQSAGKPVTLIMNGEIIAPDVQPMVRQNSTLVPLRTLQALQLALQWNGQTKTATLKQGNVTITLPLNSKVGYKDKQPIQLTTPLTTVQGRIMVPLRVVSELFGFQVNYEPERVIAFINHPTYKDDKDNYEKKSDTTGNSVLLNRLLIIGLPWVKPFPTIPASQRNPSDVYSYTFPLDDFTKYIYSNGKAATYVEITYDGQARVVWQGETVSKDTYKNEQGKRPDFKSLFKNKVVITHQKDNTIKIDHPTYLPNLTYQPEFATFKSYKDMAQIRSFEFSGHLPN